MSEQEHSAAAVEAGERRLLDSSVRADAHAMRSLLHPEFEEFGASGRVWDREAIVDSVVSTAHDEVEIDGREFQTQLLSDDVALLTYEAHTSTGASLRSSIWVRVHGHWRLRFHQGTPKPSAAQVQSRHSATPTTARHQDGSA